MSYLLSIFIPVYNEEENIFPLIDRIAVSLNAIERIRYEILFILQLWRL